MIFKHHSNSIQKEYNSIIFNFFGLILVHFILFSSKKQIYIKDMNKETFVVTAAIILLISIALPLANLNQSNLTRDPPKTVTKVDLQKYAGLWYEQADIPAFERGCSKGMAIYTLNADESIKVNNTCIKNGARQDTIGKATKDPKDLDHTNAKLIVRFPIAFNIPGSYWVVRLDEKDYTYSVVSSDDYKYLWILYREARMPEILFQQIYLDLKKDGFPVEKLVRMEQ